MAKTKINSKTVREAWLQRAARSMAKSWKKLGVEVPADVAVTCGFPGGGSPNKRIGECWPRQRSTRGVNEVMINPILDQPLTVLDVLGHELLHAVDDCKSKHGKGFSKNSRAVGYSGGKHSSAETKAAKAALVALAKVLGPYPHGEVIIVKKQQKESAGLHKFQCAVAGEGEAADVLYSTAKMVEVHGIPVCRCHGEPMVPTERKEKTTVQTI